MTGAATEHAASQRYTFVGPVEVSFEQDDALSTGRFHVRSATRRGAVAPATTAAASSRHPIIDIDGQRYLLTGPVTVIGRGSEADIIVDDSGVSRRHLEIRVTPAGSSPPTWAPPTAPSSRATGSTPPPWWTATPSPSAAPG